MKYELIYKEQFSVIGKLGKGEADNPWNWIQPIWDDANGNFHEIEPLVKKKNGVPFIWGIMSDFLETFARWDANGGKYLACCEVESDKVAPEGWVKWNVPSQTYLIVECTQNEYLNVFNETIMEYIPKNNMKLVGAVHERYPIPGDPNLVKLYFPIAKGAYFCQSCGMPMNTDDDRGTNADKSINEEYCHYCYENGKFTKEETMEEMIESCIPFGLQEGVYKDEKTARDAMMSFYPTLKRWSMAE